MKGPLPLILSGYIAGVCAGSFLPFPPAWVIAGILAGCLALFLCLAGGRGRGAAIVSPLIFGLLGWLFIGKTVQPDFPPNHLIHFADDQRYTFEGVLYHPPEPLPDKTRLYIRGKESSPGRGKPRFRGTSFSPSGIGDRICGMGTASALSPSSIARARPRTPGPSTIGVFWFFRKFG